MGRPKRVLSENEKVTIRQVADECRDDGRIVISKVAEKLSVTWQTARRWLQMEGLIESVNERPDRPGLVWPVFRVYAEQFCSYCYGSGYKDNEFCGCNAESVSQLAYVEAPNWAVACKAVEKEFQPCKIERVDRTRLMAENNFCRDEVKALCPEYMNGTLSVAKLMQHYVNLGVEVRL